MKPRFDLRAGPGPLRLLAIVGLGLLVGLGAGLLAQETRPTAPARAAGGAAAAAPAGSAQPEAASAGEGKGPGAPAVDPVAGEPVPRGLIRLEHYLVVSALLFALGMTVIVARRNAIAVLMGIELLLNAAGLNFVAFSKYVARDLVDGQVVTIFVIVIAAAEAAVALAIILNIFNNLNTVMVDEADFLKE